MGSKLRLSKHILPIILDDRHSGQYYIEPFVGGANTVDKVTGNRICGDTNKYLIAMWKAVSEGWTPPIDITENMYLDIKSHKSKYPRELVGYCGFALSYGSMWFSSYRRDTVGKRNYPAESYRSAIKQFPKLRGVEFYECSYDELRIPPFSIIYCDPPYQGCNGYGVKFDHVKFWDWCREKHKQGHKIFISEYNAPEDFICVFSKSICSSLGKNTGSRKGVEKLFTLGL